MRLALAASAAAKSRRKFYLPTGSEFSHSLGHQLPPGLVTAAAGLAPIADAGWHGTGFRAAAASDAVCKLRCAIAMRPLARAGRARGAFQRDILQFAANQLADAQAAIDKWDDL